MSVAVSTASGAGAADGLTTDAAITTDTNGTRSGYLRGLVAWFARLGALDGATFTRGSSYVWPGLAGIYESTVSTLTAGKVALARLTSRGAVVTAGDTKVIAITTASPDDVVMVGGAAPASTDYAIRDTAKHEFVIPMHSWGKMGAAILFNGFDQTLTVKIRGRVSTTDYFYTGIDLASITAPASGSQLIAVGNGATGQGGTVGGATVADKAFYNVPALTGPWAYISISFQAATIPTTGSINLWVNRSA
jgi:hypothetical protein